MSTEVKQQNLLSDLYEASEEREVVIKPTQKLPINTSTMVVIDCGETHATRYDGVSGKHKTVEEAVNSVVSISLADVLKLPEELPEGTILVSEYAHAGCPRKGKSLAQPFTEGQLLDLYERCKQNNIVIKLFPQGSTPIALALAGLEKSDKHDPVAIFRFLERFPQTSMMNPPSNFELSPLVQEGWDWKQETTDILNFARRYNYEDPTDTNVQWIKEHLEEIAAQLSNRAKDAFGLSVRKKSGPDKGNFKGVKTKQIYSILALMRNLDGGLRAREITGELPGWGFIKKRAMPMSPFHRKGGVARSNMYYHGNKHYISRMMDNKVLNENGKRVIKRRENFSPQEEQDFRYYRGEYCKSFRELFQVMKRMLQNDC
tara:strand:- start:579 stop:1697 length:1119 start_codon:yes stop_codon:yes gene_type:complete